ncbi:MAG: DUF3365 domain-containing protein, partial [Desulfobacteraceae bacterium]|nr:DUF3365 domain-containing protein [Desulfobacteraceae bacterium]
MEQAGCMHESMEITLNPFDMGPAGRYTVRTVSRGNNGGYPLDIKNISIGKQLLFFSALVFITMGIVMIVFTNYSMRKQAINEAEKKALLLLDRNLSTHSYFSHRLKPRLFEITDEIKPEGYFEPVWMSSTYAVREIDKYFQSLSDIRYYYKECAINARSPENEADAFESEFITKLNTDSGLKMASGTRIFDGVINFYVLRRGEVMGDTCLRCHSTPDVAPQEMVLQYGLERSFKRELGETVSAISIRIPLAAAYKDVNAVSAVISVVLIIVLLIIFIIQYRLTRRILVEPVEVIRTKALSVANNSKNIGEQIHHTAGKE